jgi:hypothetical protein
MSGTRRAGLILAAVATALWLGAALAFGVTGREAGANIGAALMALLAVPVSMGASATLLASVRSVPAERPGIVRAAVALAVLSLILLPVFLFLDPYETSSAAQLATLLGGAFCFLGSSALFLAAGHRGRQPLDA